MRLFFMVASSILITVGALAAIGFVLAIPNLRFQPRVSAPESLGDWSVSFKSLAILFCIAIIGLSNIHSLKRAKMFWPGRPNTASIAIGGCEILGGFFWGGNVLNAFHRYLNWSFHPGDPVILVVQLGLVVVLIFKGAMTIFAEFFNAPGLTFNNTKD